MQAALNHVLRNFVTHGRLTVSWPDGSLSTYTGQPGPEAMVALGDTNTVRRVLLNPLLAVGEAYMEGGLRPIDCTIYDLLNLFVANMESETSSNPMIALRAKAMQSVRRMSQFNPAKRARRNVAHHYDLNGRLYSLFLDRDRQYSCAYFPRGDETLEEAQLAKKRHIAAKLRLDRPDLEVLDIGCGWGGMALTLARDYGARVTGVTLSTEQLAEAQARAEAEGLSDRVSFELLDYRAINRRFDRIVSVGMFEHVGVNHYRSFFDVVKRFLLPDGVMLLHTIGRSDGPGATNPWFTKYIFPGGYSPAMSEVLPAIEKAGLIVNDVEVLRLHYAETIRHWRRRFAANRDAIAGLYDEKFCRMFEFYLAGSELAFRYEGHVNFQIQMTRAIDVVPITRDYIGVAEQRAPSELQRA